MVVPRKPKKTVSFSNNEKDSSGSNLNSDSQQDTNSRSTQQQQRSPSPSETSSNSLSLSASSSSKPNSLNVSPSDANDFLSYRSSPLIIPFHALLMIPSLFSHFQITIDVQRALQHSFFATLVLQFIYGVILNEYTKKLKKSKKKNASLGPDGGDFLYLGVCVIFTMLSAIPLHLALVLFGAPIGSLTMETFYLSVHLAFLTTYPLLITYKFTLPNASSKWIKLLTFQVPDFYKNQVYMSVIGCFMGCWLGVLPIPLDWDRDWQKWPITLLVGAYAGAFVGGLFGWIAKAVL